MDTTAQIKKNLISIINSSNDIGFLIALQNLLHASEQTYFELTQEQKISIEKGKADLKNGKIYKNEDALLEMKKWLEKK